MSLVEQTGREKAQWKIIDLLSWGADYLKRHDVSESRLSVEWILAKTLGVERLDLYLQFERLLTADELAQVKGLLKRRLAREPVQYLLGQWDFYGLPFRISPDVLIPRPETEILVECLLKKIMESDKKTASFGLDLGTGSGNIAVTLLKHLPESRCVAVDLSLEALALARMNAQTHGVGDRLEFRQGDWFAALGGGDGRRAQFDWIVSNPPYIPAEQWDDLPPEVCDHEPRLALWGGPQGMEAHKILIAQSGQYLAAGGWLALEMADGQGEHVGKLMRDSGDWKQIEIVPDNNGVDRVVMMQRARGQNSY